MAGKPEQPASLSGPTTLHQQQQLSSLARQQAAGHLRVDQHHQQQQPAQQQASLHQNSVLVYLQQSYLQKEAELALVAAEIEARASSRGSDDESGHSLGPEDDDCLGDDGSFVVSQLEAACDGEIIYQDDVVEQRRQLSGKEEEHLKLLKLSKEMLQDGVAVNGVYAGFPLDEKSLGAALAAAELEAVSNGDCVGDAHHQVAFVRQNGSLALFQSSLSVNEQQQEHEQLQLTSDGAIVSAAQVIKITENAAFANLGSCDSVRSDTAESSCSSLSSHESQEVALQHAANFVAQQAVRDTVHKQQQQQQQQILEVHHVLDDSMNGVGNLLLHAWQLEELVNDKLRYGHGKSNYYIKRDDLSPIQTVKSYHLTLI
ncbi:hypothetical protein QAD02_010619 [Eretmocerus hayati]|uniref:Uncharacterized protein n=1 Tax=Eretmocerus hayati TaxID=131215 RepID=A0ACC2NVC8_9HYME|nr:hypothetical protein QAD02_010619 [Eretmocerus hayati]